MNRRDFFKSVAFLPAIVQSFRPPAVSAAPVSLHDMAHELLQAEIPKRMEDRLLWGMTDMKSEIYSGDVLRLGNELMLVRNVLPDGRFEVTRGMAGTELASTALGWDNEEILELLPGEARPVGHMHVVTCDLPAEPGFDPELYADDGSDWWESDWYDTETPSFEKVPEPVAIPEGVQDWMTRVRRTDTPLLELISGENLQ